MFFDIFRLSMYIPDSNEEFISLGNGSAIIFLISCRISGCTEEGPDALFEFNLFITFIISMGFVGLVKKLCGFIFIKYLE